MQTKSVVVPNVGCDGCVRTIKTELSELSGVQTVDGVVDTKTITVTFDNPVTWENIEQKLIEIDYAPAQA
jgi:copper chaperone